MHRLQGSQSGPVSIVKRIYEKDHSTSATSGHGGARKRLLFSEAGKMGIRK